MSLIHDSLSKLESKKVKNLASIPRGTNESYYYKRRGFKKYWLAFTVLFGLLAILYSMKLLTDYKNQNQQLLNDLQSLKQGTAIESTGAVIKQEPEIVFIHKPVKLTETSQIREKDSGFKDLNQKSLTNSQTQANNSDANIGTGASDKFIADLSSSKFESKNNASKQNLSSAVMIQKSAPKKLTSSTKKKLSIKETRKLVNQLQMQMELENSSEVEKLLETLGASSGKESLVYLRMHAYWSNKINDSSNAMIMYKKILMQKPYDIQAGTNLALIEASNNNKSEALKRLDLLRGKYPSDKQILSYYRKIEVQ